MSDLRAEFSWNAMLRHLPDVVLVFDERTLQVLEVNRGPDGAFGYSREELLRLDGFQLLPRWWNADKSLKLGGTFATSIRAKDGQERAADIRLASATDGAGRAVILASLRPERAQSEVEKELSAVNTYLHAIVENIPDMIFVKDAATHAFRRFNRAGENLLGFSRGELLGKTDHDFYPKAQADFFHQKDLETFAQKTIVDIPMEPIQTKHQGERILHTRKIPIYDEEGVAQYLLGISEDITDRVRSEQAARELADVVRSLSDAVVTWRPEGGIVAWNPAAERLFMRSSQETLGTHFERFVVDTEWPTFRRRVESVLRGEKPPTQEVVRLRGDGGEFDAEETLFPVLNADEKVVRIGCVVRDLSELSRLRRATQLLSGTHAPPSAPSTALSSKMLGVTTTAQLVAQDGRATVLLLGETGVGKSWLAKRIHQASPRQDKPFFEINCAGLGPQLIESELFGHERGAFTGATTQKRGLVETAEGGTLFLDEIAELSPAAQAQLLTFLDTRKFRRVGGTRSLDADVRLIVATNVDLKAATEAGQFRRDLFYRLNVVPIEIPPLRERSDELPALVEEVLTELSRRTGHRETDISDAAVALLKRYPWPGNIRELRNTLERALILGGGRLVDVQHLPAELARPSTPPTAESVGLADLERRAIVRALEDSAGNRTKAAALLGISRSTLKRKLAMLRFEKVSED